MKNNYRKLKLSILLQTVFVTALTILVGKILMEYVFDNSSNSLVDLLTFVHIDEEAARAWYWRVIGNNKDFFVLLGFLLLFSQKTVKNKIIISILEKSKRRPKLEDYQRSHST